MKLVNLLADKVSVSVDGATLNDIGNFPVTLTASVDGVTADANFNVIVLDPCQRAVFETNPNPFSDVLLIRDLDNILI